MSLVWKFKTSRVGVYKCFVSLSKIERKFFVFVGIRKGDRDALWRNHYSSAISHWTCRIYTRLYIAIHNWVIQVQHFTTKGGFPPPRNFSVRTRVHFTRVKKRIEAMYERPRINVKVEPRSTLTFTHGLSYIASILKVSMGWWLLRLSVKILALLRLSINFFQLWLTKKFKKISFISKG